MRQLNYSKTVVAQFGKAETPSFNLCKLVKLTLPGNRQKAKSTE